MALAKSAGVLLLGLGWAAMSGCVARVGDGQDASEPNAPEAAADPDGSLQAHEAEIDLTDGPEPVAPMEPETAAKVAGGTVADAIAHSCTTASIKGLSQQIIHEGRCFKPKAYSSVPSHPNLLLGSATFGFMETPARDALVAALKAHPGAKMTVNSMLRTIAQQYLLYSWYQQGRCGIALAAVPGHSNHETGMALDIVEHDEWRPWMAAHGFHWFGPADVVHFDYVGPGSSNYKGLDVEAFQRLWNRNHAGDKIAEDGQFGPATAARLRKAPAGGFPIGPDCNL